MQEDRKETIGRRKVDLFQFVPGRYSDLAL